MPSLFASITKPSLARLVEDAYDTPMMVAMAPNNHDSHPSMGHLTLLVFEAVLEVVAVALPGFIIARLGHFDAEKQKFIANLNVMLFTPCLIFTKLASQLNAAKLGDLAIIPAIFVVQMLVSWVVSKLVSRMFGFPSRASNFVTAMGVFGNSNSLPISLVLSLSQTLKGLHWDKLPGDNDDDVAARGILYLLVFQQLGQMVRWSWGYHVLLAPRDRYPEYQSFAALPADSEQDLLDSRSATPVEDRAHICIGGPEHDDPEASVSRTSSRDDLDQYDPAGRTPVMHASRASPADSGDEFESDPLIKKRPALREYPVDVDGMQSFPRIRSLDGSAAGGWQRRVADLPLRAYTASRSAARVLGVRLYDGLPPFAQAAVTAVGRSASGAAKFVWEFMNPPLWAMLIAIIVASVPQLKLLFFEEDSFIEGSVTRALKSNGAVAVPLILVVLGANLARNTQKHEAGRDDDEEREMGTKLLVASLLARMVLPTLLMTPLLAFMAKYVPISILDDPIFIIVCFLLTGAPSALQLAQICQINEVYEGVMSSILFQSYVVWILPSTLLLVMCALEVLEWAK